MTRDTHDAHGTDVWHSHDTHHLVHDTDTTHSYTHDTHAEVHTTHTTHMTYATHVTRTPHGIAHAASVANECKLLTSSSICCNL